MTRRRMIRLSFAAAALIAAGSQSVALGSERVFVIDSANSPLTFSAKATAFGFTFNATQQGAGSLTTTASGTLTGVNVPFNSLGTYFDFLPGSTIVVNNRPGVWSPNAEPANFAFNLAGNPGAIRGLNGDVGGGLQITTGGVIHSDALSGTTGAGTRMDYLGTTTLEGITLFNEGDTGTFAIDGLDFVMTIPINATYSETASGVSVQANVQGQIQARSANALQAQFSWKKLGPGDFNDPNNWTGGVVPSPGSVAYFELPMEIEFSVDELNAWYDNIGTLETFYITAGHVTLGPTDPLDEGGFGLVGQCINLTYIEPPATVRIGGLNIPTNIDNYGTIEGGAVGGQGGTVNGNINMMPGSLIITGNSVGHLTADDMLFHGASAMEVEISDALGIAGDSTGGWDLLTINNILELLGTSVDPILIQVVSLMPDNESGLADNFDMDQDYSWVIATASEIVGFDPEGFLIDASGFQNDINGTFGVALNGNQLLLTYSAVPEPSTFLLAGVGALGLILAARRRRR